MNIQLTCKIASKKFIKLQTWCAISDIQDDQKFTQFGNESDLSNRLMLSCDTIAVQ